MNCQTHYCDTKARLPDVVVTVPNAIVVTEALNQPLSWAVSADVEAGRYPSLIEEAQRNYTSSICREAKLTGRKLKLDISDLGGPLIFLLIVAVCSLVINRIAKAADAREQQLEAAHQDGTLHTSAVEACLLYTSDAADDM
eukprot:877750-Prymnesium_polylepis.2